MTDLIPTQPDPAGREIPLLEIEKVSKEYPGVRALDEISFTLRPGEIVGLIGENGAGKSTFMKILGGITAPSSGVIRLDNQMHDALTVQDSFKAGIAFVHQELNLFDNLDVAANINLGREKTAGFFRLIDTDAMYASVRPILDRIGATFKPETPVASLSLADRQLLEIAKALSIDSRILILDEPTSSLTITDAHRLIDVMNDLKNQGIGIIFISHRLAEIEQCADRVVVLRDGKLAGELARSDILHDAMIGLMIGRELSDLYCPPACPPGDVILALEDVRTRANPKASVCLNIRGGEILGLAGLIGAGRTELARAVFGIDDLQGGSITLNGAPFNQRTPVEAIKRGLFLIPEDRKKSGLILDFSVENNISLASLESISQIGLIDANKERKGAVNQCATLSIKAPDVRAIAADLSGGNQQKIVLAKWLIMNPEVIIFDEPTRGIDVGSKNEIYRLMRNLSDSGVAVLMISSDMEEVVGVSDRVAVMHNGKISGVLERETLSEHNVLQLAVGNHRKQAKHD